MSTIALLDRVSFWPAGAATPALDDVSLTISPGTITLLRGPSGSGKSTLLRTLSGLVPYYHGGTFAGRVVVDGHDTRQASVAELGALVGSVFQDPETQSIRSLVASDVAFGLENRAVPAETIPGVVRDALVRIGASHLADRHISSLSGGERQRVAIASALVTNPVLLTLDEPTSQLDDAGIAALSAILEELRADGVAVVIAEHNDHRLPLHPDATVWMERGRVVDPPATAGAVPPGPPLLGDVRLAVRGLSVALGDRTVLDTCDLDVHAGEVLAVTGANGSGKSTLLRAIVGAQAADSGTVLIDGADVGDDSIEDRAARIAYLPQDGGRRLLRERVRDEVADSVFATPASVDMAIADLDLAPLADRHPLDLSVGERERVAIAATLATERPVILLDEPTRGMDHARRRRLATVVRDHARRGAAVLLITHDTHLADEVADRRLTLVDGSLRPTPVPGAVLA